MLIMLQVTTRYNLQSNAKLVFSPVLYPTKVGGGKKLQTSESEMLYAAAACGHLSSSPFISLIEGLGLEEFRDISHPNWEHEELLEGQKLYNVYKIR